MYKNIHMMGIGGIGMSGIAQLLLQQGINVSGCDTTPNPLTERLTLQGADIFNKHSPVHISSSTDLVVYSSAIREDHPELLAARRAAIPIWKRAQMLAELVKGKQCIAVTGTHGKTTVSFMIAHILIEAGLDPSFVIGGEGRLQQGYGGQVHSLGGNARLGGGQYFVVEADESDGSQIYLKPEAAVITNIDRDHLEYYSDVSQITGVMKSFIEKIPQKGMLVGCGEDVLVKDILNSSSDIKTISYGFSPLQDLYATRLYFGEWQSQFDIIYQNELLCTVTLNIPGRHNALNALASVAVALKLGVSPALIKNALSKYPGVKRRLEVVFRNDEITIIDDYAHHPTEIRAVLDTVRRSRIAKGRLIGIFQPHRFTRTKFLAPEFAPAFKDLDMLILTDIYSAGEAPLPCVDGRLVYNEVVKQGIPKVVYIELDGIVDYLSDRLRAGDTIVVMGAGDITEIAYRLEARCVKHEARSIKDEVRCKI